MSFRSLCVSSVLALVLAVDPLLAQETTDTTLVSKTRSEYEKLLDEFRRTDSLRRAESGKLSDSLKLYAERLRDVQNSRQVSTQTANRLQKLEERLAITERVLPTLQQRIQAMDQAELRQDSLRDRASRTQVEYAWQLASKVSSTARTYDISLVSLSVGSKLEMAANPTQYSGWAEIARQVVDATDPKDKPRLHALIDALRSRIPVHTAVGAVFSLVAPVSQKPQHRQAVDRFQCYLLVAGLVEETNAEFAEVVRGHRARITQLLVSADRAVTEIEKAVGYSREGTTSFSRHLERVDLKAVSLERVDLIAFNLDADYIELTRIAAAIEDSYTNRKQFLPAERSSRARKTPCEEVYREAEAAFGEAVSTLAEMVSGVERIRRDNLTPTVSVSLRRLP